MNKKIAIYSSCTNVAAVLGFAVSLLLGSNAGGYLTASFIAFSFIIMMGAYLFYAKAETKIAGLAAFGFAALYATIILIVYYAQLSFVLSQRLTGISATILDVQQFGLFFNYDMLGYALMSVSTFFAGLTIAPQTKSDKWLKVLLLIHGIFFLTCFPLPMLGIFRTDMPGGNLIGILVMLFWCIYFIPVGVLSAIHFAKKPSNASINACLPDALSK